MLYFCLLSSALIALGSSATYQNASVTYDSMTKQFSLHPYIADNHVANATFLDEIFVTGWSYLEVKSNETYPDAFQAYAAGLVEGFVTQDLLKKTWNNLAADYCKNEATYCKTLKNFLQKNLDFIKFNIEDKRQNDTYWHQVALTLEQLSGLEDGYQNVTKHPRTDVDVMGLMLLNLLGDLEDLETPLKIQVAKKAPGSGSCSALIKVLPNNRDLYFSHATWTTYSSMLRILKKYSLKFHINMETGSSVGRLSKN